MHTLYVNAICGDVRLDRTYRCMPGEVLADTGYAALAGISFDEGEKYHVAKLELQGMLRGVEFKSPSRELWHFVANFGEDEAVWEGETLKPYSCTLRKS